MLAQPRTRRVVVRCGDAELALGSQTFVMGILNVTPDSFSDGGAHFDLNNALAHAEAMLEAGAHIIDVGGESTRPGAASVAIEEEVRRVVPVIAALVARGIRCISVDTRLAACARAALDAGASWVNDVSGLRDDSAMAAVCRAADGVVVMHMRGQPATMQQGEIHYSDVVAEVRQALQQSVAIAAAAGVAAERVLVDPGIGFGKNLEHNIALMRALDSFGDMGAGVLVGPSRKRFLGEIAGGVRAESRDAETIGAACFAALHGADIVRVHDVRSTVQALRVIDALAAAGRT